MTGIGLFVVRVELYCLMFINVIFPDRQVRDVKMFISVRDHDLDTFERRKKNKLSNVSLTWNSRRDFG